MFIQNYLDFTKKLSKKKVVGVKRVGLLEHTTGISCLTISTEYNPSLLRYFSGILFIPLHTAVQFP